MPFTIDTGYKPNPKTRIETDFQLVQADPARQRIWCADGDITYPVCGSCRESGGVTDDMV